MSQDSYQLGGSLAIDTPSYVHRQADSQLYEALKRGEFCYVLNSRQMGKSSLLVRTKHRLQQEGFKSAAVDISVVGSEQITPLQWYKGFVGDLWRQLGLMETLNLKTWWLELLSRTCETVTSEELSVTLELVEVIDPPPTPTTNQLPVTTDFVEASYSEDSEQLSLVCDRCELVTEESSQLERAQQKCQTFTGNTEVENNLKASVIPSKPTIYSDCFPLEFSLYINRLRVAIKAPRLLGKSSLLFWIFTRTTPRGYKTVYLDFQEVDVAVSAELNQFLYWLCANLSRQLNLNPMLDEYREYG